MENVIFNPECPGVFWAAVEEYLSTNLNATMRIPKGKGYAFVNSKAYGKKLTYGFNYSIRQNSAIVFWETYDGADACEIFKAIIDKAPADHPIRQASLQQGAKNKDKWEWIIYHEIDRSDSRLFQWYVDTLIPIYQFMEKGGIVGSEDDSVQMPTVCNQAQHVRLEIQIAEHEYAAFDTDGSMVGDTCAFNGDCGIEEMTLYVDGEEYDFGDDDPMDIICSNYSDYKKYDLEVKWEDEEVGSIGYYNNMAYLVWEFDVEDFDIDKLAVCYDCYDVCHEPSDYGVESHILTIAYDGERVNPSSYQCRNGYLETIWSREDDEEYGEEDEVVDPEDAVCIEITPEKTIDDIYVEFTLKYPHLHLRFAAEPGVVEEVVDSSKTVAEVRKMLESVPDSESGEVNIGDGCLIGDVCREFNKYGIGDTWVCCHYGEDMYPEPHGEDRTLATAEEASVNDAQYMIAGMRKITVDGEIVEEPSMSLSLSEKFGVLAAVMSGIDSSVQKDEIDMVMSIVEQNSDTFDPAQVRDALIKELKGLMEYESHSAIVKSIEGDDRDAVFQSLVMVAVADFTLSQDEVGLLAGIAELWGWEWDNCNETVQAVIEYVQDTYGRKIEVE